MVRKRLILHTTFFFFYRDSRLYVFESSYHTYRVYRGHRKYQVSAESRNVIYIMYVHSIILLLCVQSPLPEGSGPRVKYLTLLSLSSSSSFYYNPTKLRQIYGYRGGMIVYIEREIQTRGK